MSKPFVPTPSLSRSGSPPLMRSTSSSSMYSNNQERRGDDEKFMATLGGAPRPASPLSKETKDAAIPPSTKEQILPILNYCAASIMMTVVNKVSERSMASPHSAR